MIPLTLRSATQIYVDASCCDIVRHLVDHPGLAALSWVRRTLERSLGDESREEFWRRNYGPVKRAAFALCSTPLPFSLVAEAVGLDWQRVRIACGQARMLYPDQAIGFSEVVERLEVLLGSDDNPFIEPLEAFLQERESLGVVIRDARMNRVVSAYFANRRSLAGARLISATQLRGEHRCETLALLGPCGWFPEYVLTAPRAATIYVLSYPWIHDRWKPGPLFLHNTKLRPSNAGHCVGRQPRLRHSTRAVQPIADNLDPEELLPMVVAASVRLQHESRAHPNSEHEEVTPARTCLLSGDLVVFLEAEEGSSSLIIDASELGHIQVRRVPNEELEPGMYLLLRTSGGGDYIAPLADRLMGDRAAESRRLQNLWKERLRTAAAARFGSQTQRDLAAHLAPEIRALGGARANENNVCYWMSRKCIKTRYIEDFGAILAFAGLNDQVEALWRSMEFVDRAHRRAGHVIRKMLLKRIAECSSEQLERDGYMQFDLGEQDGGSLAAFRIDSLLPEQCDVPAGRIGVPIGLED